MKHSPLRQLYKGLKDNHTMNKPNIYSRESHLPDNTNIWIKENDQSTLTIKMWWWGGGYRVQLTDISNDKNYSRCLDFDDEFYSTIQEAECRYYWLINLYNG